MGTEQPLRPADPRQLGRYQLTGRLGAGGMGIVYAGRTGTADGRERLVAVKVIHPHLADAPEFRTRFRSEATLAARVARFCTAAVLDVDVDAEQPYLVTEFVDGPTLQEVVEEQGPLSGSALDAVAIGIAVALIAIHESGIVHRDLKPSNVILSRFGPRVIDFGIARAADVVTGLTSGIIGSPPYMAPEQFRGEPATTATDIHAWGAVMCYAGTGQPPFGVASPEVMLYRALHRDADVGDLDEPIRTLVQSALSKDIASRPSARALLERLAVGNPGAVAAVPAPPAAHRNGAAGQPGSAPTTTKLASEGPLTMAPPVQSRQPATEPVLPPAKRGRRRAVVSTAAAMVAVLALAAGGAYWWSGLPRHRAPEKRATTPVDNAVVQVDADDAAKGPAPAVSGARRGGTVVLYASAQYWRLDPAINYYADGMMVSSRLLSRTLTTYREDGAGRATLVGDLATNTGRTTDGGRTWEFTLRDGVRFEDGKAVTAADVAHGIALSFRFDDGGPTYLQQWLTGADQASFRTIYPGPSTTTAKYPPGVTVVSDRVLRLQFRQPHPELPSVATLPNTAAVPLSVKQPTDDDPLTATGPYKIASKTTTEMVLTRNESWDRNTDPVRTDYPAEYIVRFGTNKTVVTDQFLADAVPNGVQLGTLDSNRIAQAQTDASERLLSGSGLGHRDLCFNTQRIVDPVVRRALGIAFNRDAGLVGLGGAYVGDLTGSLLSRRLPGYASEEPSRTGDPAKATKMLAGKEVSIVLGYLDNVEHKKFAETVKNAFTQAGATVTLKPINRDHYLDVIGQRDNPYDAYLCELGPDYLDGDAQLSRSYQGTTIRPTGNKNVSYFNEPSVNAELNRLAALPDRKTAATGYAALEKKIREKYAPVIPFFDQRRLSMRGGLVEGLFISRVWGVPDLSHVWVQAG